MRTKVVKTVPFVFLAAVLFCGGLFVDATLFAGSANARETPAPAGQVFVIGRVSGDPQKHYPRLRAMADYLGKHLKDLGVSKTAVKLVGNNRDMLRLLSEGEVDFISETPFSALLFAEKGGTEIILREWKKGVASYHTVFIARKDGGIDSISDLEGRIIAFEDRGSTSSFLVPMAVLGAAGIEAVEMASLRDSPPAGKVGYVFAESEENISLWVHKGFVHAGAYSNQDWEKDKRTPVLLKKDLKIVFRTAPMVRSVVSLRRALSPAIKKRVKDVLLGMHRDPEGREVLKRYFKVKRYDEIRGEAASQLAETRNIYTYLPTEPK